jgi:hypothetical protein
MDSLTSDEYRGPLRNECGTFNCVAADRLIEHLPREKQAMEMTEYGKHGKP